MSTILYSTNPVFTEIICETYRNNVYEVWCCECFNTKLQRKLLYKNQSPPSSNPKRIYEGLLKAVRTKSTRNKKINDYKNTFTRLAHHWLSIGDITKQERDDILASIKIGGWDIWRPQLYLIPREPIESAGRLHTMPVSNRAGLGVEQKIIDLKRSEFDIIELL